MLTQLSSNLSCPAKASNLQGMQQVGLDRGKGLACADLSILSGLCDRSWTTWNWRCRCFWYNGHSMRLPLALAVVLILALNCWAQYVGERQCRKTNDLPAFGFRGFMEEAPCWRQSGVRTLPNKLRVLFWISDSAEQRTFSTIKISMLRQRHMMNIAVLLVILFRAPWVLRSDDATLWQSLSNVFVF